MLYAIWAQDVPNSLPARKAARPAHLARLEQLQNEGRLILAGPMPAIDSHEPSVAGMTGTLVVAEFGSLKQAETWAQQDPYVSGKVFEKVSVKPFIQVLP